MYRTIVGRHFEDLVLELLDQKRADHPNDGKKPDIVVENGLCYVEVKAGSYARGGVINRRQLERYGKNIDARRFYAFAYHSLAQDMRKNYPTKEQLLAALDLRSLYFFPISVVQAHFDNSKKRTHPLHDDFVQLSERVADKIFRQDESEWQRLGLDASKYTMTLLDENIFLTTKEGKLEKELLAIFNRKKQ